MCPAVADDVLLLTKSQDDMQDLLETVEVYTCLNRHSINPSKTEEVALPHQGNDEVSLTFDTLPLHATDRVTHIGVLQGSGTGLNKARAVSNVSKAHKACYGLGSVGILKDMNPVVGYSMFRQYVEPILLYGTETWIRAEAAYRVLDVFYLKSIKVLQGLPDRVATVGGISLLGALPISAKIHLRRLLYYGIISRMNTQAPITLLQDSTFLATEDPGSPRLPSCWRNTIFHPWVNCWQLLHPNFSGNTWLRKRSPVTGSSGLQR